jgi:hypothetical protein
VTPIGGWGWRELLSASENGREISRVPVFRKNWNSNPFSRQMQLNVVTAAVFHGNGVQARGVQTGTNERNDVSGEHMLCQRSKVSAD